MKKRSNIKEAVVLLIATMMILTTVVATANTGTRSDAVCLSATSTNDQASLTLPPAQSKAILWDNGDTDGINGLSNAPASAFGYRRAVLDDFEIPSGETWTLGSLHMYGLWNTMQPGSGTDFVLQIWSDSSGTPGSMIESAVTVAYTETATGRTWFSRPEFEVLYEYQPITLGAGTYWIWAHIVGPENCFWMARVHSILSDVWIDYEDYPPLQPGYNVFLAYYDLSYWLGEPIAQAIPDLDCSGDLDFEDVEPNGTVTGTITVENVGDIDSELSWEIQSFPDWGTWTFDPESGTGLLAGDSIDIDVTIVAPDVEEETFEGEVVLVNSEDDTDTCTILVSLVTPVSQSYPFLDLLAQRFPILAKILAMIL